MTRSILNGTTLSARDHLKIGAVNLAGILSRMTVGEQVDVNMDTVLHMQRFKDQTTIHFAVSQGDTVYTLTVKETPDEIHSRPPQAARGG